MKKSNYITGPKFLSDPADNCVKGGILSFEVSPSTGPGELLAVTTHAVTSTICSPNHTLISLDKYSDLDKYLYVYSRVRIFVEKLKKGGKALDPSSLEESGLVTFYKGRTIYEFR